MTIEFNDRRSGELTPVPNTSKEVAPITSKELAVVSDNTPAVKPARKRHYYDTTPKKKKKSKAKALGSSPKALGK